MLVIINGLNDPGHIQLKREIETALRRVKNLHCDIRTARILFPDSLPALFRGKEPRITDKDMETLTSEKPRKKRYDLHGDVYNVLESLKQREVLATHIGSTLLRWILTEKKVGCRNMTIKIVISGYPGDPVAEYYAGHPEAL